MKRLYLFLTLIVLLFSCKEGKKKQNFVFILVDDLGWADLGYTGSSFYETPNIDAFSNSTIQFTNAYASGSVCSPARASILTGRHPARIGITDWIPGLDPQNRKLKGPVDLDALPLKEVTIAEVLKNHGYRTFFAGKWHLGGDGFLPQDQGFETNIGGYEAGHPPNGYYTPYKNPYLPDGPEGEYLTNRLTDESIKFLDTINDKPFFLYLSYYTVHTPIQPNLDHIDKFKQKLKRMGNPEISQINEGEGVTRLDQGNPAYASMVYTMDENVGRLIKKLKEEHLYENTTIIFTSDNGGLSTLDSTYNRAAPTSVRPLRGGKGWLYEGGIRVPLLIKPANYEGGKKIISEPVIGHDFFPTILDQANIPLNKDLKIDGVDLTPLLHGKEHLDRKELFWHYPHYHGSGWTPGAAIRQGDWKLIEFYETNTVELYNLSNDLSETKDLSSKYPEKVSALKQRLHDLQKSINADSATLNPDLIKKEHT